MKLHTISFSCLGVFLLSFINQNLSKFYLINFKCQNSIFTYLQNSLFTYFCNFLTVLLIFFVFLLLYILKLLWQQHLCVTCDIFSKVSNAKTQKLSNQKMMSFYHDLSDGDFDTECDDSSDE